MGGPNSSAGQALRDEQVIERPTSTSAQKRSLARVSPDVLSDETADLIANYAARAAWMV
jgi:hypothetical protein